MVILCYEEELLKKFLTSSNHHSGGMAIFGHLSFHLDSGLDFTDDDGAFVDMNALFFPCVINDHVERAFNFHESSLHD